MSRINTTLPFRIAAARVYFPTLAEVQAVREMLRDPESRQAFARAALRSAKGTAA